MSKIACELLVDYSGEKRDDLFYCLEICDHYVPDDLEVPSGTTVSASPKPQEALLLEAISIQRETEYPCSQSRRHSRQIKPKAASVRVVQDGTVGALASAQQVFMQRNIYHQISEAGFTGLEFCDVAFPESRKIPGDIDLVAVSGVGRQLDRTHVIIDSDGNHCGKCGYGPIYCSECTFLTRICPNCGFEPVAYDRSDIEDSAFDLVYWEDYSRGQVFDLGRWDGRDFICSCAWLYVTKRVLDFFLRKHYYPFQATGIPTYIGAMEETKANEMIQKIHGL